MTMTIGPSFFTRVCQFSRINFSLFSIFLLTLNFCSACRWRHGRRQNQPDQAVRSQHFYAKLQGNGVDLLQSFDVLGTGGQLWLSVAALLRCVLDAGGVIFGHTPIPQMDISAYVHVVSRGVSHTSYEVNCLLCTDWCRLWFEGTALGAQHHSCSVVGHSRCVHLMEPDLEPQPRLRSPSILNQTIHDDFLCSFRSRALW